MRTAPDPGGELAMRLASYRQAVQDPDVWTEPVPTEDEREAARQIAHSIRLSVKVEDASRGVRLSFTGLLWVLAGSALSVIFNNIFDVPLLAVAGGVCSLIGLIIMLASMRVRHKESKAEEGQWDPRILNMVKAEQKAESRQRRAELAAKVRALPGRLRRER